MGCSNLNKLKDQIEDKREVLNNLVVRGTDEDILVNYSVELDELIYKYHNIELKGINREN